MKADFVFCGLNPGATVTDKQRQTNARFVDGVSFKIKGHEIFKCWYSVVVCRGGLTVGQTGQMPGASRLNIKTLFYWFFMFLAVHNVSNLFDYCV